MAPSDQSISVTHKRRKRGRPATGERRHISARLTDAETCRIEEWARANSLTRSEAVRRLLQKALDDEQGITPST